MVADNNVVADLDHQDDDGPRPTREKCTFSEKCRTLPHFSKGGPRGTYDRKYVEALHKRNRGIHALFENPRTAEVRVKLGTKEVETESSKSWEVTWARIFLCSNCLATGNTDRCHQYNRSITGGKRKVSADGSEATVKGGKYYSVLETSLGSPFNSESEKSFRGDFWRVPLEELGLVSRVSNPVGIKVERGDTMDPDYWNEWEEEDDNDDDEDEWCL